MVSYINNSQISFTSKNISYYFISIQLIFLGTIGFDSIGLHIPMFRQLVGFIYLTFVPGLLLLGILQMHKLPIIEVILYSVGLSISSVILMGVLVNYIGPFLGILKPFSEMIVVIAIFSVNNILYAFYYLVCKNCKYTINFNLKKCISPITLSLILIPFLSVFGTYMVNIYKINTLLMILIIIISLLVFSVTLTKSVPKYMYPFIIFIISISLLYHTSLISMELSGWDIHTEYYYSNLVMTNSLWDSSIPSSVNAMLSIVTLIPLYSTILNMTIIWVFKIICPFLFSFVPLALYQIYKKQTNDKIAFLSCFFFMSLFVFYTEMLSLIRQQIAELFLVLIILIMIDRNIDKAKKSCITIIFLFSLIVSHYGLSYLYIFCLIGSWTIVELFDCSATQKLMYKIDSNYNRSNSNDNLIKKNIVVLTIVAAIAYYINMSSSYIFESIVKLDKFILDSIATDFLNRDASSGLDIIVSKATSPLMEITKYLHIVSQFLIFVGLGASILNCKEMNFEKEYKAFSIMSIVLLISAIVIPNVASSFNTSRIYHVSLIFLAPFCVIGGIITFKFVAKMVKKTCKRGDINKSFTIISTLFLILFLLNTKFIFILAHDHPTSISIGQNLIEKYGTKNDLNNFYSQYNPEEEIYSAKWLSKYRNNELKICADRSLACNELTSYIFPINNGLIVLTPDTKIPIDCYICLGYANVHYGLMYKYSTSSNENTWYNITDISPELNKSSIIYTAGFTRIYKSSPI